MNVNQINYLNIGLMLVSAALSFIIPFELFLFAYAVLGPLHYLTEISWLQKSKFYVPGKYDAWWLAFLGLFITLALFPLSKKLGGFGEKLVFVAFFSAIAFVFIKKPQMRWLTVSLIFLAAILFTLPNFMVIWFTIFLPTLIHVFIFTGAFILFGSLKSKSVSGYLSLVVFVACTASFFLVGATGYEPTISNYIGKSYSLFLTLNKTFLDTFSMTTPDVWKTPTTALQTLFTSDAGIMVMRFIAFAYTYHYLNWFSKTSVIKWHEVSRNRLAFISILWLISVGLYLANYHVGLKYLYFLSITHVFLEFPLNVRTFMGIGKEVGAFFGRTKNA